MKTLAIEIEGVSPLLMNRYQGEVPSAEKAPRGGKTQKIIDDMHRADWMRAAYHDGVGFHIPPENIEAAVASGASRFRKGSEVERSVAVLEDRIPLLVPNGHEWVPFDLSRDEAFERKEHVDTRGIGLGSGKRRVRFDRCRPIFREWRLRFRVVFDPSKMSEEEIKNALGNMCIGDFRPRFGRVRVLKCAEV